MKIVRLLNANSRKCIEPHGPVADPNFDILKIMDRTIQLTVHGLRDFDIHVTQVSIDHSALQ